MMRNTDYLLTKSWACKEGNVNTNSDILNWINNLNSTVEVSLEKVSLEKCDNWLYDEQKGEIRHKNNIFFQISGIEQTENGTVICRQPIVQQHGIGYLGMICKEIDGILNFLVQAKIEPGNVNRIQISPTLQATLSNFTQRHGGAKPKYLEYFQNSNKYEIIADQIHSEQASRFYKKRNRNIVIKIDDDIEVLPMFKWITIGQLKEFMRRDNLVNMDTRTVLSCLPYFNENKNCEDLFNDKALYHSIFNDEPFNLPEVYNYINDYKMRHFINARYIPLYSLENWSMKNSEFVSDKPDNFKIVFCDIGIEGREVIKWSQPLVEATGQAVFGLITCVDNGIRKFLVKAVHEVGSFDYLELGPTVQREPVINSDPENSVDILFNKKIKDNKNILANVILSEEGGRFYQEQNQNIIVNINKNELDVLPEGYFWLSYKMLNLFTQFNNCLNIQLRNLISLLEV